MKFDLHMHSEQSSDGQLSVDELLAMAKEKGLDTIALCDHDSVAKVREIIQKGKEQGIEVLPAIEITTNLGDSGVHLLGYGIDLDDPWITSLEAQADKIMNDAFHTRVVKVTGKYGIDVDEEDVIRRAAGKNPWFTLMDTIFADPKAQEIEELRPYLKGGERSDPAPVNFFWDKCQNGTDLYVPVEFPDLLDSIARVRAAGGVPIIAHPFKTFYHNEEALQKVQEAGAMGLEAYSNYHTPEQIEWYKDYANQHGLLITCGSDFHGEKKPSIEMGEYHMEEDGTKYLEALKKAMEQMKKN